MVWFCPMGILYYHFFYFSLNWYNITLIIWQNNIHCSKKYVSDSSEYTVLSTWSQWNMKVISQQIEKNKMTKMIRCYHGQLNEKPAFTYLWSAALKASMKYVFWSGRRGIIWFLKDLNIIRLMPGVKGRRSQAHSMIKS